MISSGKWIHLAHYAGPPAIKDFLTKNFLYILKKKKTKKNNNFLNEKTFHARLKEQLILHPHPTRIKKFLTKKVLLINPQKTFFKPKNCSHPPARTNFLPKEKISYIYLQKKYLYLPYFRCVLDTALLFFILAN